MDFKLNRKFILLLLVALPMFHQGVSAQSFTNASSVDLYDTQVFLINPGALKFQDAQLIVGSRILHYGFVDKSAAGLNNSYVSVTFPDVTKLKLGLGLLGINLNTPFYSENRVNLLAGIKLSETIGVGTQFGILTKSFDRDEFVHFDQGDPLFKDGTSKYAFNIGLGAYWQMKHDLHFGLAVENLNRPNISFVDDNVYQSRVVHFSANYLFSGLEASGGFVLEGSRFFPGFGVSTSYQGIGILKLGIFAGNLDITGQMHISEKISFDYKYSYPLSPIDAFSNGSHRMSLSYRFGDIPYVNFEVFATVDSQKITEERLYKKIDDNLTGSDIVKYDFVDKLISANDPVNAYYHFVPIGRKDPLPKIDFDPFLQKYLDISEFLGEKLQTNEKLQLRIIVAKDSEKYQHLARSYSDYFEENFGIHVSRIEYGYAIFDSVKATGTNRTNGHFYQSNHIKSVVTHFVIKPIISRKYNRISGIQQWALMIKDSNGELVKKFQGNNEPPELISWDWKTQNGEIIGVGKYSYFLEWKDERNKVRRSPKRVIQVSKAVREITVKFTEQQQQNEVKHLRIDWLLGK